MNTFPIALSRLFRLVGLWGGVALWVTVSIGCGKQGTEIGEGGSVVTGSGGPTGERNAAPQMIKCDEPVAVVSLNENQGGYAGLGRGGLPESPLPLVRVIMQQSGCFRIVDRNSGLKATVQEQELKAAGILRQDQDTVRRGQGIVSQYTVVPSLNFVENDAGRQLGGILSMIPVLSKWVGVAEQVKFKEAQVVLLLTDNETTEQLSSATGAARTTDLGIGGLAIGQSGGIGGMGWSNTNEAKVIAAAFLDAHNHLVQQVRTLVGKPLPAAVPVKKAKG